MPSFGVDRTIKVLSQVADHLDPCQFMRISASRSRLPSRSRLVFECQPCGFRQSVQLKAFTENQRIRLLFPRWLEVGPDILDALRTDAARMLLRQAMTNETLLFVELYDHIHHHPKHTEIQIDPVDGFRKVHFICALCREVFGSWTDLEDVTYGMSAGDFLRVLLRQKPSEATKAPTSAWEFVIDDYLGE